MKKIITLLFTAAQFLNAHAQFTFGPKVGVNITKENYSSTYYSTSHRVGLAAGIFTNYTFGKHFGIQAELIYSSEGTKESSPISNGVVTINRINIPLLFQYKHPKGIYIEAGPQIGLLQSAKGKYTTGNYDFKTNTQSNLLSWCVGAGYQLNQLVQGLGAGIRYAKGFTPVNKGNVNATSITSSVFNISVFYAVPYGKNITHNKH